MSYVACQALPAKVGKGDFKHDDDDHDDGDANNDDDHDDGDANDDDDHDDGDANDDDEHDDGDANDDALPAEVGEEDFKHPLVGGGELLDQPVDLETWGWREGWRWAG